MNQQIILVLGAILLLSCVVDIRFAILLGIILFFIMQITIQQSTVTIYKRKRKYEDPESDSDEESEDENDDDEDEDETDETMDNDVIKTENVESDESTNNTETVSTKL